MSEYKTDLRIVKTHNALFTAFIELLKEKDFEDITVNELCNRAMIRRPTFYKHFADKYDFFAFFVRCICDSLLKQDTSKNLKSHFLYMLEQGLNFLENNLEWISKIYKSTVFPNLVFIFCDVIRKNIYVEFSMQKEIAFPSELSMCIQANYIAGGIAQLLCYWMENRNTISKDNILESFNMLTTI